ncbi:hypothetical protein THOM_2846 [Trachipleistophora hominis]|uniref:Uncharacterized protein n=1 Tax=Trachipleistophora hominis TaxID=72359 RepID=L7JS46_TRAHO|nr:hypothetical protein THOM_2846 [Trachipleistophora hominis]
MMNPRFGLNSFDPFIMGMGRGLGTPMPYYKSSLFLPSRSWRL